MYSLFMYHTLRIMFDVADNNSIGSGLCLGISQEASLSQLSFNWSPDQSPATYASSEDFQFLKDQMADMVKKLNILIAKEDAEKMDGPVFKEVVGCCSTLCFIFVIMAHDVVLFVPRESTRKKRGIMFPLRKCPIVN